MSKIYSTDYRIKSYDVDFRNKLKIARLLNLVQEYADLHEQKLNASYEDLWEKNCIWVLSRIYIEINELPQWDDIITIKTWPKDIDRLFGLRDFEILDQNYESIIKVTSNWLIINFETRKPVRIQNAIEDFSLIKGKQALNKTLDKLCLPQDMKVSQSIRAQYSDIDINQHVNNGRYFEWLFNDMGIDMLENNSLKSIESNFISELKYDTSLSILKNKDNNKLHYLFKNGNKDIFKTTITFK